MKYEDYELDENIQELIDEVPEGKLREELDYRMHRLIEIEKSFLQSQESLVNSQIELEKLYSMGDLTVDQFYGTVELLRKAEI